VDIKIMPTVSTTETFASRNKASKQLADENASLIRANEILKRENAEFIKIRQENMIRSSFTPEEYEKVEREHLSNMKGIEEGIIQGRIEASQLENALVDKRASLLNMNAQEAVLAPKLVNLNKDIEILLERRENAESSARLAESKYSDLITRKSTELSLLTNKVNAAKNAHLAVSREMEQRMASVVEQERALSIRRTDLEIYEARLRAKYPRDPIIL
jgi:hypothetical protein